ncbi:MAG: elongation factor P maturation arginine rhamnosyltransferase EarP [Pusillimonas sp.]|nr:elongation factor P maturation arginine rhamnosyltransferase EarP [Pusillimonas sp.]
MSDAKPHRTEAHSLFVIDLFCQVIDNYGDIGVCWRLARQLTQQTRHCVRLWVDNLAAFQRLAPQVNNSGKQALSSQITLYHWSQANHVPSAGDIVIEAFGCQLPELFISKMVHKNSLWINLEYLSAEDWVGDCHGLPSFQPNGLRKYFFFPGFTPATGGLLREPDLFERRNKWLAEPALRWAQLSRLGVSAKLCNLLQTSGRQVFLFNYPSAPVNALIEALETDPKPTVILQPQGSGPNVSSPAPNIHHVQIPFVPQPEFDSLLWSSDLNLVRGEDSVVRAHWAGKPFIWHIYPQADHAHLTKLSAWLNKSPFDQSIKQLQMAWNQEDTAVCKTILTTLLSHPEKWQNWQLSCQNWGLNLGQQPDLATNLLQFFTYHAGTR